MPEARFDVTTVGEVMIRLSVPVGHRLDDATTLDLYPGGSEGNVTVALAQMGRRCAWASALPTNPLGRLIANRLRVAGVNLDTVVWSDTGRVGSYYVEFATPPRAIQVVYDRADSCASRLRSDQLDWDALLDTRLVHLTGITPAISPSCRAVVTEFVARARAAGIPISFDINYRARLWSEAEATAVLTPLVEGVEFLFCGQADARRVFGCGGTPEEMVRELADRTGARHVIVSFGADGARLWDGARVHHAAALPTQMVDRLGAGDGLAAGVIHGWLNGDVVLGLRYGVVLAALALSQYGDMLYTIPAEVEALLQQAEGGIHR